MFRYKNVNPNKSDINDCTIRAISVAKGISWDEAYEELSTQARRKGLMMDSAEFIEGYLDKEYSRICPREMTVAEFLNKHLIGTYLITMKGHITVIKDGILYDTFDCSDRIMWCAWHIPKGTR